MQELNASWQRAWRGCAAAGDGGQVMTQLLLRYGEPQRHYHTQQHLRECLQLFERYRHLAQHPAEVELGLWFHDAIYEVRSSSNEADSAEWARQELSEAAVAPACVARISGLILATQHVAAPQGVDQQLLVDIDLAILGAARPRFDEYETQIRQEYAWVPAWLFRRKRRAILEGFLQRPRIYATPQLHDAFEARARDNVRTALQGRP